MLYSETVVDSSNNIWVTLPTLNTVRKITQSAVVTNFTSSLNFPNPLVIDNYGVIYIGNDNGASSTVSRIIT